MFPSCKLSFQDSRNFLDNHSYCANRGSSVSKEGPGRISPALWIFIEKKIPVGTCVHFDLGAEKLLCFFWKKVENLSPASQLMSCLNAHCLSSDRETPASQSHQTFRAIPIPNSCLSAGWSWEIGLLAHVPFLFPRTLF